MSLWEDVFSEGTRSSGQADTAACSFLIDLILALALSSLSLSPCQPAPSSFPRQHVAFGYIIRVLAACLCMCMYMSLSPPLGLGNQIQSFQGPVSIQAHVSALFIAVLTLIFTGVCVGVCAYFLTGHPFARRLILHVTVNEHTKRACLLLIVVLAAVAKTCKLA